MIKLILKRQRQFFGLTCLALLGIILTVGLLTNASFFTQAVDRVILLQELEDFSRVTGRPPFSTSAYVFPSTRKPLSLEDAERLSGQISNILTKRVGLPLRQLGFQISSEGVRILPDTETDQLSVTTVNNLRAVYIAGIKDHMEIVDGKPMDEAGKSGEVLDVWMHERLAEKTGANVGDTFNIGVILGGASIPVRLAGTWRAKNPQDDFWFSDPDISLNDSLLVRRQDYISFFQPLTPSRSKEVNWYIVLDEKKMKPQNSASYLQGFQDGLKQINKILPGTRLNSPPLIPLGNFVQRSRTLTIILLSYYLPAFTILLSFLILISAILAQWQRKDNALFSSRGMSKLDLISLTSLDQILLFTLGIPLGIAFGMSIARLMGYTSSFLSFTDRAPLPVSLQGLNIPLIALALALSLLVRLWPVLKSPSVSVVTEEREWARPTRPPFWYRYYLDLLLILPTYYAYDQMTKQGSLAGIIVDRPEDLYQDPLIILVPALFVITASLVTMRLFSWGMRLADLVAGRTSWLTLHLALRQLGRQSYEYSIPLLLVIVTLAMGVYTVSMAKSLDQWLVDRMYYRVGTDLTILPEPNVEGTSYIDGSWIPAPEEFRKIKGVLSATRVIKYPARFGPAAGQEINGDFLAIDRVDFPSVSWFRKDLTTDPLVALMNQLALNPEGILVPGEVLEEANIQIGDKIPITVNIDTSLAVKSDFTVVGSYTNFPTIYQEDFPTVIGNFDYLSSLIGFTLPHRIWMRLAPGTTSSEVLDAILGSVSVRPEAVQDTQAIIREEQGKMERVGIFGTLTTGFLATAIMAILGLLIYSYASLRDRTYNFAVMNALGLSRHQITTQVGFEFTFLCMFGALAGALIGRYTSMLFIPFFRYTGEAGTPLPPLLPIVAEQEGWILALAFTLVIVLAELVTVTLVLRRQLAFTLKRDWV